MKNVSVLAAIVLSFSIHAGEQAWRAEPASANWNTADLNWDDGVRWTQNSAAKLGESSTKAITVKLSRQTLLTHEGQVW